MKKFIYCVIIIIAILLQVTLLPVLFDKGAVPDSVLMLVLALSVLDGFFAVLSWTIFIGVLYDFASYSPIGLNVIVFLILAYLVSFFSRRFSLEVKVMGFALFSFFVVFAMLLSHLAVSFNVSQEFDFLDNFLKSFVSFKMFIVQFVYNLVIFFGWFYLIRKVKRFFSLEN